ncbi:hypothetical protein [Pyramidobacter porci]
MAQPTKRHGLGMVAARPDAIGPSGGSDGCQPRVEKRIFLADRAGCLIPVGSQTLKAQTPHRVFFFRDEKCAVRLAAPVRHPADDEAAEKERLRRQLV